MKNVPSVSASLLILISITVSTFAFDTAPHFDLTRAAAAERGFSDDAIKISQLENWLTDYYSSSPTISRRKRESLEKLHFDNLFSTREAANYWARLIENLRIETRSAALADDPFRMLVITGIGLHAVQDFYTHSNWAELHPRSPDGAYRSDTFLNTENARSRSGLYTGKYPEDRKTGFDSRPVPAGALPHGGYDHGVNKDSPVRPKWDEAYVFAYAASLEMLDLFERWAEAARSGFWDTVRHYTVSAADRDKLEYDLRALRNMSMWIKGKGQDGHWKGDRSGSSRFFTAFSGKWVGKNSSRFVKAAAEGTVQEDLARGLYADTAPPPLPRLPKPALKKRAVLLRISHITELKDDNKLNKALASTGGSDFYARIAIGAQEYWERTIQGSRETDDPWFVIHFTDQSETAVPVEITVWDEDDPDSSKDRPIDINPSAGKRRLDLIYRLTGGAISGDLAASPIRGLTSFTSTGATPDSDRASIAGNITHALIK